MFRDAVMLAAIIVLGVFCVDKSRQNQRTRNALYNCIYVLYGAALAKAIQFLGHACPLGIASEAVAFVLVIAAAWGYARWFKPQQDIPYNNFFRMLGWSILALLFMIQTGLLLLVCFRR